jgi:hypothetical protein
LSRLDAAGDDAGFDGFAVGHLEPLHDGLDAVTAKMRISGSSRLR